MLRMSVTIFRPSVLSVISVVKLRINSEVLALSSPPYAPRATEGKRRARRREEVLARFAARAMLLSVLRQ